MSDTILRLLERGLARASDEVAERGEDWLDKAADKADELATERLADDEADAVRKVTAALRDHAPHLAQAGGTGVLLIAAHLAGGAPNKARLAYLRSRATAEERSQARMDAGHAMGSMALERERAWDAFMRAVARIGEAALRAALPFLLAALPL